MRPLGAVFAALPVLISLPVSAFAAAPSPQLPPADSLKDGEGVELVRENCLYCHDDSYIVSLKLARDEWDGILDLMLGMGMPPLEPEAREQILEYLAVVQGTDPDSGEPPGAGAAPTAALPVAETPWAEPRYRPNPLDWKKPER